MFVLDIICLIEEDATDVYSYCEVVYVFDMMIMSTKVSIGISSQLTANYMHIYQQNT